MIRYRIGTLAAWDNSRMINTKKTEGLFSRLGKTRESLTGALLRVFSVSEGEIPAVVFDGIEDQLILGDLGVEVSREVVGTLRNRTGNRQIATAADLRRALRQELTAILQPVARPLVISPRETTQVVLVVGVNGVGKTTTVANWHTGSASSNKA